MLASQLLKKFISLIQTEISLPCSQIPCTEPYSESHLVHIRILHLFKLCINIFPPSMLGSPKCTLTYRYSGQIFSAFLVCPKVSVRSNHFISLNLKESNNVS
jgi:hypothetical protein